MSRTKITGSDKKTPNLDLRGKVGNKVIGIFQGRYESKMYPGKFSSIISVIDTDGDTTLAKEEVEIEKLDNVFLNENTVLANAMSKLVKGQQIEVVYLGKGKAKKGQNAPFLYDVFILNGEEN